MHLKRRLANLERRWPGRQSLAELQRRARRVGVEQLSDAELEALIVAGEAAAGRACSPPFSDEDLERIAAG